LARFTPESLESYLREEYSSYLRNPIIQASPLIRVSVLGYVRDPGSYRVEPDRPLWDVIAMAGGPNDSGDITQMLVSRSAVVRNDNLLTAYEEGVSLREIGIQSGDQTRGASEARSLSLAPAYLHGVDWSVGVCYNHKLPEIVARRGLWTGQGYPDRHMRSM